MQRKADDLYYRVPELAELLGVSAQSLARKLRSVPGFPAPLPGFKPYLWSRKAVDDWFKSDGGRRPLADAPDPALKVEIEALERRYGGGQ